MTMGLLLATHDGSAADGMCASLMSVRTPGDLVDTVHEMADTRLECAYRELKPTRADDNRPARKDHSLDPTLTKEQQVEVTRRRIEARWARMRAELDR